jgi:hypothetical protein
MSGIESVNSSTMLEIASWILALYKHLCTSTAGWSSGLWSRLRNQRSRVRILVVSRGFCDEQLHLLASHGCLYYIIINIRYMYDLCISIRYLVFITQVLKDT